MALDLGRIERAADSIDLTVRDSPCFASPSLNAATGLDLVLKVEVVNPLRSFKGRGGDLLMRTADPRQTIICASAGNLGQGLAWAGAKHNVPVRIYSSVTVPTSKLDRMRAFGADVVLVHGDFDEAKQRAAADAAQAGRLVVDGIDVELAEGAATIAVELTRRHSDLDVVLVAVGNGSLAAGMATWLKHASPRTRIIAVGAAGAPAMRDAWATGALREGPPITTCAEGLAARVPVGPVTETVRQTVDDFVLVDDAALIDAMKLLHGTTGLVIEASGAAPLAAARRLTIQLRGTRTAVILGGGNASKTTLRAALNSAMDAHPNEGTAP